MVNDWQRSNFSPLVVKHHFDLVLSGSLPATLARAFCCSPGRWGCKTHLVMLRWQRGSFPRNAPQNQPLWRRHAKIDSDFWLLNGFDDLALREFAEGKAKQRIGCSSDLIPKKGFTLYLETYQTLTVKPWFGLKNGPQGVLAFLQALSLIHI